MYIKKSELDFLKSLFKKINLVDNTIISDDEVYQYYKILKRLSNARKESNIKTKNYIAEKRKTDKNYARPKKREELLIESIE